MITYESICEKLGFKIEDYHPKYSNTEDDSRERPFDKLTVEELSFLCKYISEVR